MELNHLISSKRTGAVKKPDQIRTYYQRDFDRIIFSSAFRRLQNKTQIFALPGSTFVHNRLTHSLETASVGRSLGKSIGEELAKLKIIAEDNREFYRFELQNVIAAACLAHDIGNPPFGHSGEKAISNYFQTNRSNLIDQAEGKKLSDYYSESQWKDLTHFEGNANSFRVLTHQIRGKPAGGFRLTYTTLASILKYPCSSGVAYSDSSTRDDSVHKKKYSFFEADREEALKIMRELKMMEVSSDPIEFRRNPLVFLTEAADDICYRIIDYEDAYRLNIISFEEIESKLLKLVKDLGSDKSLDNTFSMLETITDRNEKISFLRAKVINFLTLKATEVFLDQKEVILEGKFNQGLIDFLENEYAILGQMNELSRAKIYNHLSVVRLEIAGFKVMSELLSLFIPAILKRELTDQDRKILLLLPEQFKPQPIKDEMNDHYLNTLLVLDYFSGMTDPYITELYRQLLGIEVPKHH